MKRDPATLSVGTRRGPAIEMNAAAERLRALMRSEKPAVWWVPFAVMLLGGAAFLYYETRGTTFWADEWSWMLTRRGSSIGTYLDAYNGHLSLVPLAIYKLLFATVGLRHYGPYRAMTILAHLGCTTLLFVYARRRVGGLLALMVAALLLFFGPGWQAILWPFQVTWLLSLGAGVAALLTLDRGDGLGRAGACALTAVSLASSGIGVPIAVGVLVDVVFRPGGRRWWWIAGGPLALYALWSIGYQDTTIGTHAFVVAPDFAWNAAASSLGAVLGFGAGLAPGQAATGLDLLQWGKVLTVLGLLLALWRIPRLGRPRTRTFALLATGASYWLLTGLARWFISTPYESRYLYVGALIVLLLMVELAAGLRIGWVGQTLLGAVALAAVVTNLGVMRVGARFLFGQAQLTRAQVGVLDITRPIVQPGFKTGFLGIVQAGQYFAAERALPPPSATPAQILTFAEPTREAADSELEEIHALRLVPAPASAPLGAAPALDSASGGSAVTRGSCTSFTPASYTAAGAASAAISVTVPQAGLLLRNGRAPSTAGYRRFGAQFQTLGTVAPGALVLLRIGPDLSSRSWHLQISSNLAFSVCGLAP